MRPQSRAAVRRCSENPTRIRNVRHRLATFHAADDEPGEADTPETEEKKPAEALVNELESRLLKERKVMVFGQINDKLARHVVARILTLAEECSKPSQIYVTSPGGQGEAG